MSSNNWDNSKKELDSNKNGKDNSPKGKEGKSKIANVLRERLKRDKGNSRSKYRTKEGSRLSKEKDKITQEDKDRKELEYKNKRKKGNKDRGFKKNVDKSRKKSDWNMKNMSVD